MVLDLKTLTEWLEFEDRRIDELKKTIIMSWDNPKKLRAITDRQCEYREQTHCYSCRNESGCLVLNGISYLRLGEIETAIKELETANLNFRNQDDTWKHIISLTLIGDAHSKNRKKHRALREFEKALEAIQLFKQMHSTEFTKFIERATLLEKAIQDWIDSLVDE
jgi:hypothetical protein